MHRLKRKIKTGWMLVLKKIICHKKLEYLHDILKLKYAKTNMSIICTMFFCIKKTQFTLLVYYCVLVFVCAYIPDYAFRLL